MGKYEVTWDEYDQFATVHPGNRGEQKHAEKDGNPDRIDAVSRPSEPYMDMTFGYGREGYPAICMTHHAAMAYCRWLSLKTGRTYRLPTEAEWEYACRAGSQSAYFFDDDSAKLGDYAWYEGNSEEVTHPVGQKKPNRWGLYDMLGNVGEWCLDSYDWKTYAEFSIDKSTLGPVQMPMAKRFPNVVRGGSWDDKAAGMRCAARKASDRSWNKQDPDIPKSIWWLTNGDTVGFRIVRAVEEQDNLKGLRPRVRWDSE
jgi:formylglycine-generating enzyme required for sulfatase activity